MNAGFSREKQSIEQAVVAVLPSWYKHRKEAVFPIPIVRNIFPFEELSPYESGYMELFRNRYPELPTKPLLVVFAPVKDFKKEKEFVPEDFYPCGTLAAFEINTNEEEVYIVGLERVNISWINQENITAGAHVKIMDEGASPDFQNPAIIAKIDYLAAFVAENKKFIEADDRGTAVVELWQQRTEEIRTGRFGILLDVFAAAVGIDSPWDTLLRPYRYAVLEAASLAERLDKTIELADKFGSGVKEIQKLGQKNRQRNREEFLREHKKAIESELGEDNVAANYKTTIEKMWLPDEVRAEANVKLGRLKSMREDSHEFPMIKNWFDLIIDLPWKHGKKRERFDPKKMKKILDQDHYGMEEVKDYIIEFMAARALMRQRHTKKFRVRKSSAHNNTDKLTDILGFVGPPGVGKTSIGRAIAEALGRKFVKISLGGVRDEAEIRGHRLTYIGAEPGIIIQNIRRKKTTHLVVMLDEGDKIAKDMLKGNIDAALLEVLDPEQNFAFTDHFLGVPYDLSDILFIVTANVLDLMLPALKDRIEFLEIVGYTEKDKLQIAERHLIPQQLCAHALDVGTEQVSFEPTALVEMIRRYAKPEAGVRNLKRAVKTVCRKIARGIAEGSTETVYAITSDVLLKYLGVPKFAADIAEEIGEPGVAVGLAVSDVGETSLYVETSIRNPLNEHESPIKITGGAGEMFRESVEVVVTAVQSNFKALGIQGNPFKNKTIHINIDYTTGTHPTEGPSAGLAVCASLLSFLLKRRFRSDVAMTGAVNARGMVRIVGGIKGKALAAERIEKKIMILPKANESDWQEVPADVRDKLTPVFVKHIIELPDLVLEK